MRKTDIGSSTASSKKPPVVRCGKCEYRGKYLAPGFLSSEDNLCKIFSRGGDIFEVSLDDGCTFGKKGKASYARKQYDVVIGDDAAVNGRYY